MTTTRNVTLTPEFSNDSNTAPAAYWLASWAHLPAAVRAIKAAAAGKRSCFEAPLGMMMVSPA